MDIQEAIALLKANGYRVTKPAPRKAKPTLNAVGRPFGALYDPNYKIKTPLTKINRLLAPMPRDTKWVQ